MSRANVPYLVKLLIILGACVLLAVAWGNGDAYARGAYDTQTTNAAVVDPSVKRSAQLLRLCPPGTRYRRGRCVGRDTPPPPSPSRKCRPGWTGKPPVCCPPGVRYRRGRCVGRDTPPPPPPSRKCRPGWTGKPPVCCPPGQRYHRGQCLDRPHPPRECKPGWTGKPPVCCPPGKQYSRGHCCLPGQQWIGRRCKWLGRPPVVVIPPEPVELPQTHVVPPPPYRDAVRPPRSQPSRVTPPTVRSPRAAQPSTPPVSAANAIPRFRPAELLVLLRGSDSDGVAQNLARSFNLNVRESTTLRLLGGARVYRLTIPDNRAVEGLVTAISRTPGVSLALPNYYSVLQGSAEQPSAEEPSEPASPPGPRTDDPSSSSGVILADSQYALVKLHVPEAQKLARGKGVIIAVIDSAVDTAHPVFRGADIEVLDAIDTADNVSEPDDHGTAITGVIVARGELNGLAPEAKIIAVRAFAPEIPNAPPVTTSLALASAVEQAFDKGARVFNMSFAGPRDPLLIQQIDAAYAEGAIFLAAAGNNGPNAPPAFPAAHDKVIAVTATDAKDKIYSHANQGKYISVAAPGVDILVPVTAKSYDFMSGTSFAVAHVSGIVALLMEHNPDLKTEDVRRILTKSAHDLGPKGPDERFGAGLADAYETLAHARVQQ